MGRSFPSSGFSVGICWTTSFLFLAVFFLFNDVFCVMLFVDDAGGGGLDSLYLVFSLFSMLNVLARGEEGEDLISLCYLLKA